MRTLEENTKIISPLLKMIDKEGVENSIKIMRVLTPQTLKDYIEVCVEIKEQLKIRKE